MAQVLHIQASPRGKVSYSIRAALALLDAYAEAHPGDTVETLDLAVTTLPEFRGDAAGAKMTLLGGGEPSGDEARAWRDVRQAIERLKRADKLVVSAPMWNFGLPYALKHYVDLVVQPRETFRYTEAGKVGGLMKGRPCVLVLARGGRYAPGTPGEAMDFQLPYLKAVLGFMGFGPLEVVLVEPTAAEGPDAAQSALTSALVEARRIGRTL